ncbi:MAG TPA: DUF4214 domain-containing protein [Pyrinomonadaceae bacterium]|nr:DUF4214 domain-containing protein [Pyrinomonadaceae bacterium]
MRFISTVRTVSKLSSALLLLLLFGLFGASARAQKRAAGVDASTPAARTGARQIAGKRRRLTRPAVVNILKLARKEKLSPAAEAQRAEEREEEEVEPPEPMPENMPVPSGAIVVGDEKPQSKAVDGKVMESPGAAIASPAPASSFPASDDTGRFPPDTHGAVGLNHLMVVHNGRVRIQDRAGNVLSNFSLVGFWASVPNPPSDIFDPKVLYDPYANRWMMTSIATRSSAASSILIGVSQTSDPTGNWNLYRVDADSADILWADYPSMGFNKSWIVVQANMYPITEGTGSFLSHIYVFNKANLYAGGSGLYTLIKAPNLGGTMVPAITYDSTLSAIYLLQNWNGNSGGSGYLGLYSITGAVGSEVLNVPNTTSPTLVGTPNPWAGRAPDTAETADDFAPQLSSTLKVQNNDSRIQNLVYRNGSLWSAQTVFLPAGSTPTRAAIQWWELSPTGTIRQRGRIDDPTGTNFYAFPSIAVNRDNDVLIGYSRYSPVQYVSGNYSFRAGTDPINTMRDDTVLKAGTAPYYKIGGATPPRNRWGDFSSTVVDPVNDKDMWTIQEYAATPSGGSDKWATWWGRVSLTATPSPGVQIPAASFSEGAGRVTLPITLTNSTGGATTVNYSTSDTAGLNACNNFNGVASSRCDYATSVGTLQYASGETTKTISIPLVDDAFAEGTESFTLNLSLSTGFGVDVPLASITITITDNDAVPGNSNPVDQTPFFVRQHYIDFLGREPDAVGLQGWQNILNNCPASGKDLNGNFCDRVEVSSGFFRSEEFQTRGYFVYRFYSAVGRIPLYTEFMPDFAKVSGFLSAQQLEDNKAAFVNEFMTRTDYQAKYGSITDPTAYVNALLSTVGLPNHPSKAGWIAALISGTKTKAKVFRELTESGEVYNKYYTEAFVIMQYFGYLRRSADISYLQWIQIMNQTNGDYRTMISGFLNSAEYRQRFGQ